MAASIAPIRWCNCRPGRIPPASDAAHLPMKPSSRHDSYRHFADKSLDNDLRRIEHSFTTQISIRDRMGHTVLHPQTLKSAELSTTLADLLTLLFLADPGSAVRTSLRTWSHDEVDDDVANRRQRRLRGWAVDSFFPASLF